MKLLSRADRGIPSGLNGSFRGCLPDRWHLKQKCQHMRQPWPGSDRHLTFGPLEVGMFDFPSG